jgi:O-antigen ligase
VVAVRRIGSMARGTRESAAKLLPVGLAWLGVLIVSGLVGMSVSRNFAGTLGLCLAVAVVGVSSVKLRAAGAVVRRYWWIPPSWVVLAFAADHRFGTQYRSTFEAASGELSIDNAVQLLIYALVGVLVLRERRALLRDDPIGVPKGFLVAWPSVALVSTAWSIIPKFTVVRALQLFVVISLAVLSVRIWRSSPDIARLLWTKTLRLLVQVVTLLAVSGFLFRDDWLSSRFTWEGAFPGVAGTYLGVAFLILALGGRALTGFSVAGYWSRLLLFGVSLYFSHTRSVLIAILVAILAGMWFWGRRKVIARYAGIAYAAIGTVLLFALSSAELLRYFERGESARVTTSLTGRIPLWEASFRELSSADKWLFGFGYGSPRVILPETSLFWQPGTAHNSWIELLLGVGLIGTILAVASFVYLLYQLFQTRFLDPTHRVAFGLIVYLLVVTVVSEIVALPGIGFALFALLYSLVLAERFPVFRRSSAVEAR